jgi:hypothetical protein
MALRITVMAALALTAGACSSDLSLNNLTLAPKPETLMRKPDWATFSTGKNDFLLRPITAADLVSADGQCAAAPGQGFADPTAPGAAPPATGGVDDRMRCCTAGGPGRADRRRSR